MPSRLRALRSHPVSADWNSFTTDFFVPPEVWVAKLEANGRLGIDRHLEEAKLKRDLVCHLTGVPLRNMPALKQHVASSGFQARCREQA